MMRLQRLVIPILLLESLAAFRVAGVTLDSPGHVLVEGTSVVARGGEPGEAWTIVDWRGHPMAVSGTFDGGGDTVLPKLPAGYYTLLDAASSNRLATVAIVPSPSGRVFDHGSFYGVDSAQSWLAGRDAFLCPWNGGDTYRTISDLIRLAGVPHVRDRLGWRDVEREPGRLNIGRYMSNANLLRKRGILVSGMFRGAPG